MTKLDKDESKPFGGDNERKTIATTNQPGNINWEYDNFGCPSSSLLLFVHSGRSGQRN